ncbi:MAG: T9SS type A sorting domain-containing protein [Bacteroidetes bacterium]|nr:T9SS type A sorting domain-containing protein [Bacteroidota bacterium]
MKKISLCLQLIIYLSSTVYCAVDLAVTNVKSSSPQGGTSSNAVITIRNAGNTPISNFQYSYKLNGVQSNIATYAFTIQPNDSVTLSASTFTVPMSNFTLCGIVNSPLDLLKTNDTICKLITLASDTVTVPFTENFDDPNFIPWYTFSNSYGQSSWEHGLPSYGVTNSTHSAPSSYDIKLTQPYLINNDEFLVTPFFNVTGHANSVIEFWMNYDVETSYDGMRVEYSTNGTLWQVLGGYLDPQGLNWYNEPQLVSSGLPAISGSSGTWIKARYKLGMLNLNSHVKFRFVFNSDNIFQMDGISIDDFQVYYYPSIDAELLSLNNPSYPISTAFPISISVTNNGTAPLQNIPVGYSIDGGAVVNGIVAGPLASGATTSYNFPQVTTTVGKHEIRAFTLATNDSLPGNDTLIKKIFVRQLQATPYFDDFEGANNGWYTDELGGINTKWELGTPTWGSTNTCHSGTKCWDVNLNVPYTNNATVTLNSPLFYLPDLPGITMEFWMNFCNGESVFLEYTYDSTYWYLINTYTGLACGWTKHSINLQNIAFGSNVQFRFRFASNNSLPNGDGVSIDDFKIIAPPSNDVALDYFRYPRAITYNFGTMPVVLNITNFGVDPIINCNFITELDGILQSNTGKALSLQYLEQTSVQLPSINCSNGNHILRVFINYPTDANHANDTISIPFAMNAITYTALPYQSDFETGLGLWFSEAFGISSTNWEFGTPSYGVTTGAYSGINCWDVNLNVPYTSGAETYVYSPIFDFTNAYAPRFSSWLNYRTDWYNDGAFLEYTTDGGTWNLIGSAIDTAGINWYTANSYVNNHNAWTNESFGWQNAQYNLELLSLSGPVQFRFGFISSAFGGTYDDGVSIDDFKISVALQQDAGIAYVLEPGLVATANTMLTPKVILSNNGSLTLNSVEIKYMLNNIYMNSYSWTGSLNYGDTQTVTLPPFNVPVGINTFKAYVDWGLDINKFNDTAFAAFNGILSYNAPYIDNFDSATSGWFINSGNLNSKWEYGSPSFGQTNSCYSGNQCWDINLYAGYKIFGNSTLTSPFFNYIGLQNSKLGFYYNTNTEYGADGLRLEFTTNGKDWNILGGIGQGTNWYNSYLWDNQPGWSFNSQGWKFAILPTPFLDGNNLVQCRFRFISDLSINMDGVTIDDFMISDVVAFDEQSTNDKLMIWPNPANDKIYFSGIEEALAKVSIFNAKGELAIETQINNKDFISVELLKSGIYLVKVVERNAVKTVRLVK